MVPLGIGTGPRATPMPEPKLRAHLGAGSRQIVLSVSAKRPHKNLARLIGALRLIPAARRPLLVLPGYSTAHEHELRQRAETLAVANDVRFLGWVNPAELEGLYAAASLRLSFVARRLWPPCPRSDGSRPARSMLLARSSRRGGRGCRTSVRPRVRAPDRRGDRAAAHRCSGGQATARCRTRAGCSLQLEVDSRGHARRIRTRSALKKARALRSADDLRCDARSPPDHTNHHGSGAQTCFPRRRCGSVRAVVARIGDDRLGVAHDWDAASARSRISYAKRASRSRHSITGPTSTRASSRCERFSHLSRE